MNNDIIHVEKSLVSFSRFQVTRDLGHRVRHDLNRGKSHLKVSQEFDNRSVQPHPTVGCFVEEALDIRYHKSTIIF